MEFSVWDLHKYLRGLSTTSQVCLYTSLLVYVPMLHSLRRHTTFWPISRTKDLPMTLAKISSSPLCHSARSAVRFPSVRWNQQQERHNSNNKYISRALNHSVSHLPQAQSAVHVQWKLSKLHYSIKTKQTKKPATSKNKKQTKKPHKQKPGMGG